MDDEENSQERYAMMPPYSLPAADGETPEEGDTVRSGAVRDPAVPVSSEDEVVEALRTVFDPEIPVNIYDLGLIYDLKVAESGDVDIMMTLTAPRVPGCWDFAAGGCRRRRQPRGCREGGCYDHLGPGMDAGKYVRSGESRAGHVLTWSPHAYISLRSRG